MDKEKILDKVTKLMALAYNPGANTNEAATALRQARSLMARYNIESDELRASLVLEASIPTGTRRSPADWLHSLAATCATAFDCSHLSYYHPSKGYCFKFLGKGIGPDLAAYAYSSLILQLQKARREHVSQQKRCQLKTKRRRGQLFAEGWIAAVAFKVREFAGDLDPETQADITAYLNLHHPQLERSTITPSEAKGHDSSSLQAGIQQGQRAQLHRGVGRDTQPAIALGGSR
ncbi:DUF2786 domain-containing protein [Pseudomonas sp. NyZ201]|uniref:DUF2786 domain-containing protein n=1 Tax=Pseudomonas sp. NyZ201 TaxID=3409857 RepID=UPI003CF8392E